MLLALDSLLQYSRISRQDGGAPPAHDFNEFSHQNIFLDDNFFPCREEVRGIFESRLNVVMRILMRAQVQEATSYSVTR